MPTIAIALALVLAFSGGISLIAQNTHPGDVLYPFKINIDSQINPIVHEIENSFR